MRAKARQLDREPLRAGHAHRAFVRGLGARRARRGNDGHVTDVFTFRGTHTEPLRTRAGDIPATNKKVELAGCFLFETRGGKIVASRNYYDLATILRQLGVAG